ncbi:MAG TPA: ATP-binding protein [Thermoanaerobaculia bacterium]|nr:ATP-binding protein [Thermoanaerobaculia bacterium]
MPLTTWLPWCALSLALFGLAVAIWARQRASRVAVLFCAMIVFVAIWFAAFALLFASTTAEDAGEWARLAVVAVAFLPAAVYEFTITAMRLARRRVANVLWLVSCLFTALIIFSNYVIAGLQRFRWGWYPRFGVLGIAFVAWYGAALLLNAGEYVREYRQTVDPVRRGRIRDLLIAFTIVYCSAIDFAPMFGVDRRPVAYIPVLAFIIFAAQNIRRHRLRSITAARAAREILETMADALFVLDADGRIRVINDAARKLFGYSEAEILGKPIDVLEEVDASSVTLRGLRGAVRDQERVFISRNDERIDVSISVSAVHEDEVEEGAVVIVRDIRERKRAEQELHTLIEKLRQSNAELEDFAHVASHDLQEPLRKIQAFGERLRMRYAEALSEEGRDYVARMQSAAQRMQRLINDLLAFSRITTKAQPFVRVDLEQVAADVVHDLEVRLHDTQGEVRIGELPVIEADPLQMRQLLQNLVGNALKFHREGVRPVVEIEAGIVHAPRANGNGRCELTIRDNGIGFEEQYAERIFTMFERLHGRGKYEGTGIGLAICRKIVQRHHGDISARSAPGAGATFVITLPLKQ